MFLKNYYKALALYSFSDNVLSATNIQGVNVDGNTYTLYNYYGVTPTFMYTNVQSAATHVAQTSITGNPGVIFGDGDTAVTFDDHALAGNLFTTFSFTQTSVVGSDESGMYKTVTFILTNTGDTAFTIKEIGLMGKIASGGKTFRNYLFERTVLESPVTIEPGGIGEVTYTVRFNIPPTA